jgi:hypothetical protein
MQVQPCQVGNSLQRFKPLWKQYRIRRIDRRDRKRSQDIAMIINDGDDFFAFLVFVAGVANAIASFFSYGIGSIAVQHAQVELLVIIEMLDAGAEGEFQRAIVGPPGKGSIDGGVVDFRLAVVIFGYG